MGKHPCDLQIMLIFFAEGGGGGGLMVFKKCIVLNKVDYYARPLNLAIGVYSHSSVCIHS